MYHQNRGYPYFQPDNFQPDTTRGGSRGRLQLPSAKQRRPDVRNCARLTGSVEASCYSLRAIQSRTNARRLPRGVPSPARICQSRPCTPHLFSRIRAKGAGGIAFEERELLVGKLLYFRGQRCVKHWANESPSAAAFAFSAAACSSGSSIITVIATAFYYRNIPDAMLLKCGDTFLLPKSSSDAEHRWIIVAEIDTATQTATCVNVTTQRSWSDTTCILNVGDHPFVKWPSVVFYRDAREVNLALVGKVLIAGIGSFVCTRHDPCSDAWMDRIRQGLMDSRQTPKGIKAIYRTLWKVE